MPKDKVIEPFVETGPKPGDRLLGKRELLTKVPASFPQVWKMMRAGTFPRSVKFGARIAWYESEIEAWLANLERSIYKGDEKSTISSETFGHAAQRRASKRKHY
jgi:predicted DNA-binding transcriptional regulator AlpA